MHRRSQWLRRRRRRIFRKHPGGLDLSWRIGRSGHDLEPDLGHDRARERKRRLSSAEPDCKDLATLTTL